MKTIIYFFFLLISAASAVDGQTLTPQPLVFPPLVAPKQTGPPLLQLPSLNKSSPLVSEDNPAFPPQPGKQGLFLAFKASVRILHPDNMPCLMPDLTRLERMPVNKMRNTDRMPNAVK